MRFYMPHRNTLINTVHNNNKDVSSIKELKDFIIATLSGNQEAVSIVKKYDFTKSVSLPKAQQARVLDGYFWNLIAILRYL